MKLYFLVIFLITSLPVGAIAGGNHGVRDFSAAKKLAARIHEREPKTIYCGCQYSGKKINLNSCGYRVQSDAKRASRLEWEHVVPAEAFGNSFAEWRSGGCFKRGKAFKGRKCAETNPEFSRMEADLYNLWPEIGELNGLRNNYSMAELGAEREHSNRFGECRVKVEERKFEPMPAAKGRVARTYLYMDEAYPGRGILSEKNEGLMKVWDSLHPVDHWECERARIIERIQGNENPVVKARCKAARF